MSDRVSHTVLLCEDDQQARLVRAYLRHCRLKAEAPYLIDKIASRAVHGGNVGWVLREFPKELRACRQRAQRAKTLLIVVIDADDRQVSDRRTELDKAMNEGNHQSIESGDPCVLLIPRRHIETWIRAALENPVNEDDDYKRPAPTKKEIREAAERIHCWARNAPPPGKSCVPSLRDALPEWRRIG